MDQNNLNSSPFSPENFPQKKSYGALIAVFVILFVIIIGGLYFLGQNLNQNSYILPENNSNKEDSVLETLQKQNPSDDLQSIEDDLNSTDLENLDQGAASLEAELE